MALILTLIKLVKKLQWIPGARVIWHAIVAIGRFAAKCMTSIHIIARGENMKNNETIADSEKIRAILALDLESIKRKLMNFEDGLGWSQERADQSEIEYKRFLAMAVTYPDVDLVPSVEVDQFWHAHILDTRKYAADCEQVLGFFLHHAPDTGPREAEDVARQEATFAQSRALYEELFGVSAEGQTAWCGLASEKAEGKAAWCGLASEKAEGKAAWCGLASGKADAKAAWCGRASGKAEGKAAWCGRASEKAEGKAAWCGRAAEQAEGKAAWCGRASEQAEGKAAWCGIAADAASGAGAIEVCAKMPVAA